MLPRRTPRFRQSPSIETGPTWARNQVFGEDIDLLYTEALGQRDWHGRTAILVDEHTAGAAEMVAQFAQENGLATIVGMKTPGRLVTRRASKLGLGYRLVIPIAAYVSAKAPRLKGRESARIFPSLGRWDVAAGIDRQLIGAVEALRAA